MCAASSPAEFDVIVVGGGMSGLYALKVLREQGLRVVLLEKAPGVGGTWYWNRYPGARCDIPSLEYSFGFDPELEQEWEWTEHFASQPEIERYLNHLADRYDLRRDIRLSTGVRAMTFDEETDTWVFDAETGEQFRARFAVMATGGLSAPNHRHRGDGFVRRAGDPRAGQGGRAPDRVPAHGCVHLAVAQPAPHPRPTGGDQGAVPRTA